MSTQNAEIVTNSVKPVIEGLMSGLLNVGFKFFLLAIALITIFKIIEILFKRRK